MPNSVIPMRRVPVRSIVLLAFGATLLACAQNQPKSAATTESEVCGSLRGVLAQADTGFVTLRGSATTDYDHTRWDAKPIIKGTQCDVIGWGGGRINYACSWNKGNEATARGDYEQGLGIVQRCLGPEWKVTHPAGQTGQASLFAKEGDAAKVEVRYYKERDPSNNWQTSLTIGPPVTRDAR